MNPEILPWLNALVAFLLTGNIFFIKRLVDRIEKTLDSQVDDVQELKIQMAVLLNRGKGSKEPCPSERKVKQNENAF